MYLFYRLARQLYTSYVPVRLVRKQILRLQDINLKGNLDDLEDLLGLLRMY